MKLLAGVSALFCCALAVSCSAKRNMPVENTDIHDHHSYSHPEQARVRHIDFDWDVLFDRKMLKGSATLTLDKATSGPLVLDTEALTIEGVEASADGSTFGTASFEVGKADTILGAPLTIEVPASTTKVRIRYSTSPHASALQWLTPEQTAGKKQPFLFTQCQAIHARSIAPLQDTPSVRFTYTARVRTPKELLAVMSAENDPAAKRTGEYQFRMPQPIPSYLIALAVGDLDFRPTGNRTGVYAEPPVVQRAAREFEDTEKMIEATESLYGPYRWGRYDVLVLPPSFPYGGMENPRVTFATPTVLAGDKSLVGLIAHELAHSWSGNLVTNATWRDFWLNEGFTVYVERRVIEQVYGRKTEEMHAVLGRQGLQQELSRLDQRDQILHIDLKGRDPDEGVTDVPYEKGALFVRSLEQVFGRQRLDEFLRGYFDHFAFQSITTAQFVGYLRKNLLDPNPQLGAKIPVDEWLYKPGLPASAPQPVSAAFDTVEKEADRSMRGEIRATALPARSWTTQEWLHFLKALPEKLGAGKMAELDQAFHLTQSGNAEIEDEWLLMAIRNQYKPAYPRVEEFLTSVGRMKYLRPLYREMVKTPEGRQWAERIYEKARPGYHPIAQRLVDGILKSPAPA
jgi:leukotriene-A4 hydrolase